MDSVNLIINAKPVFLTTLLLHLLKRELSGVKNDATYNIASAKSLLHTHWSLQCKELTPQASLSLEGQSQKDDTVRAYVSQVIWGKF